ncbi:I78 family peptidase inhibitor [Sphingomonas sp. 2R-10]|uniref:I78 family peptidase inhibitor n=1 Tax=Sphingomonas sp. 2R-10 TaxID=3045148 RepID=UPI0013DDCF89|nr:I78 family peptidase inhibitor [Sphingomonas sp. 2R-10]MDJ0277132.1 I78 family peptidase inhibitor [Sphingomonas sp. 2R-10]
MKFLSIIVTTLALGACTTPQQAQSEAGAPPELPGDCGAGAVAGLVGKPFSAALEAEAKRRTSARTIRAIRPGTAVTMDFQPNRLNIDIDEKNVVTGFRCG